MHDPHAEDADAEFEVVRKSVLARDKRTCRYCQMKTLQEANGAVIKGRSSGYFEVHHLDDDHRNSAPENLITVCPFCHSVFHCGNAGHRESGSIIWAPWIRQEDLNAVVHVLFILMTFEHPGESDIKKARESLTDDVLKAYAETGRIARQRYEVLQSFGDMAEEKLGDGMSNAAVLGESLMTLGNQHPEAYARRSVFLGGARFLPDFGYYLQAARYWANANNFSNKLIHATMLKRHYEQYDKIVRRMLVPDVRVPA
jgi:hypothetical protein